MGLGVEGSYWSPATPPPRLQMIDSSVSLTQERPGSGVKGQGSEGAGHILAPERTNRNTLTELRVFQKRARGYISYTSFPFLFLSLCLEGFGPVFEKKKSPSEVSIH